MVRQFVLCISAAACLGAAGCHGGCGGEHIACQAVATGLCWVGANMAYREEHPDWSPPGNLPVVGDDRPPEPLPGREECSAAGH